MKCISLICLPLFHSSSRSVPLIFHFLPGSISFPFHCLPGSISFLAQGTIFSISLSVQLCFLPHLALFPSLPGSLFHSLPGSIYLLFHCLPSSISFFAYFYFFTISFHSLPMSISFIFHCLPSSISFPAAANKYPRCTFQRFLFICICLFRNWSCDNTPNDLLDGP